MGTTASSSLSSKSGRAETIQALLDAARVDKSTVPTPNDLPRSTKVDGRFIHKSSDFPDWPGQLSFIKWQRTKEKVPVPTSAELEQLPVRIPDLEALQNPPVGRKMQATWLGHASVLTQFDGWNVLADPIFSKRCSPVSFAGTNNMIYLNRTAFFTVKMVCFKHVYVCDRTCSYSTKSDKSSLFTPKSP